MDYDRLSRENEYIKQAKILSNQYTVVCTNPPYMGKKSINSKLSNYLYQNYPTTKSEMYSAFIERCYNFTKEKGYLSMITIHSWMFISSFEELRNFILNNSTIINMVHTGASTFIDLNAFNVLATAFCLKKEKLNIKSTFVRLVDYYKTETKIENFRNTKNYYNINQDILNKIPQKPFVYWISDEIRNAFCNNKKLGKYYPPKQGIATADNKRFLRLWYEVDFSKIAFNISSEEESLKSNLKWYPYNKGGNYRKWYGNNEYVVNWQNNGKELKKFKKAVIRNKDYQLKEGITWSLFGFENFGVRYKEQGFIFDVSGSSMFPDKENLYYVIGYLCSNVAFKFLSILAPTVNFQVGNIASLPYKEIEDKSIINELVKENIEICKKDWDSYETSWNFKKHPLINDNHNGKLKEIMKKYKTSYNQIREKLKNNEQKLNKIYSEIFDVTTIETDVNDRDLTIKIFDEKGLIKSLISYSVGCMFGRYSLDKEGLVFAGGEFNFDKYKCFKPVIDNIIPLNDCIVNKFKEFIEVAYGKSNLNDNLDFIAEILGKRTNENSEATIRRYFMKDFYNEHFKIYHKKPIYWLLNDDDGNKCLTYMHRTYKYDIKGEK